MSRIAFNICFKDMKFFTAFPKEKKKRKKKRGKRKRYGRKYIDTNNSEKKNK